MIPNTLLLWVLVAIESIRAQDTSNFVTYTGSVSTLSTIPTSDFSGSQYTYISPTGQSTVSSTTASSNATATSSSSGSSQSTVTSSSKSLIEIGGNAATTTSGGNSTASSTSSSLLPSNTVPCNNYPEFCTRKYSNITEVCAHNSAFSIPNNAASNQERSITQQLNDGIRMLQGETHYVNETVYNCHTSCSLLNAGTWQSMLETAVSWLEANPYEVLTILIVNSDYKQVDVYVPPIQNSGIMNYLYEPQYIPQHRDQWPTLGEMILTGKRVVMFMDYNANQTAVPYILDEFTHMWETPFSPTNQSFPCTQQRPPGLKQEDARNNYMYLVNHNLNTAVDLSSITGDTSGGSSLLIPNYAELNLTNGEFNQYGQLEANTLNCTQEWENAPNFLLVDYYNVGTPGPGSVFEVAAKANGVTYNRQCCGTRASAAPIVKGSMGALGLALLAAGFFVWY